jgi:LPXTG-motif cell wall-anchored protein
MKQKLLLILALLVVITIALPIAASGSEPEPGRIEVRTAPENTFHNTTTDAFQIFSLEGSEATGWSYRIHPDFEDFSYNGKSGQDLISHIYSLEDDAAAHGPGARSLTEALMRHVRDNGIESTESVRFGHREGWNEPNITSVVMEGLPLGYYLISGQVLVITSAGAGSGSPFLGLASTGQDLTITPKLNNPFIDMTLFGSRLVGVGDTVSGIIEAEVPLNVFAFEHYVYNISLQTWDNSLELIAESIEVRVGSSTSEPIEAAGNYELDTGGRDVVMFDHSPYLFMLVFSQSFIESNIGGTVYVSFSATVNELATITWDSPGYRDSFTTISLVPVVFYRYSHLTPQLVTTRSDGFNQLILFPLHVYKFTGDISEGHIPLGGNAGTRFGVSTRGDLQTGGDVALDGLLTFERRSEGSYTLILDQAAELNENRVKEMSPDENGLLTIRGLGGGSFYLYETSPPQGFSRLSAPQSVTISYNAGFFDISPRTLLPVELFMEPQAEHHVNIRAVAIQNNRSSMFPETGGIGTGIFLIIGSVIMTASGIALIIRKRISGRKKCVGI